MKRIDTALPDVFLIEPKVFGDSRGYFFESFNQKVFDELAGGHVSLKPNADKLSGNNKYVRLDSYNPSTGEIVSRKHTQLADIDEKTAKGYLNELSRKYPPNATIANVPSSGKLGGETLQGLQILEVPIQNKPIPQGILDHASSLNIDIRQVSTKKPN